jgi:hypothetical protein
MDSDNEKCIGLVEFGRKMMGKVYGWKRAEGGGILAKKGDLEDRKTLLAGEVKRRLRKYRGRGTLIK